MVSGGHSSVKEEVVGSSSLKDSIISSSEDEKLS